MIEAFVPQPGPGYLGEPPPASEGGMNADAFDSWSKVHLGMGLLFGILGVPFGWTIGIGVAYEVLEYAHEYPKGSVIFGSKRPESAANLVADMVLFLGGWAVANGVRRTL